MSVGAVVSFAVFVQALAGQGQRLPFSEIPVRERLWTAQIANGNVNANGPEFTRAESICGNRPKTYGSEMERWAACMSQNFKPARHRIATVHSAPSASSSVIAVVHEEMKFSAGGDAEFAWSVELTANPGRFLPWPEATAAFDYGLHIAGVQRREGWVRLLQSIPVDGWLQVTTWPKIPETASVYVYVEPLDTQVLDLSPLLASWPDGSRRAIAEGSYLIVRVGPDFIEFRAEIPSDFACGDPVTDPAALPPLLRAAFSEFFDRDGTSRFSTKYTKGC